MENLYKTLEDKKNKINSMEGDLIKGDYYLYFLETFVPRMIKYRINHLQLEEVANNDSLDDITLNYRIHFFDSQNASPSMSIDEENVYFHLSSVGYNELVDKMIKFFGPHAQIETDPVNPVIKSLVVECPLTFLIARYGLELAHGNYFDESITGTTKLIEHLLYKMNSTSEIIASQIHAKYFEEEFLDKYLVGIIKKHIDYLNQRNIDKKLKDNIPINYEFKILPVPPKSNENMYIPVELSDTFLNMIKKFLSDYRLGEFVTYNGFAVRLRTNLYSLMDAYYMEKQRIDHYTNLDYLLEEKDPKAKKITI